MLKFRKPHKIALKPYQLLVAFLSPGYGRYGTKSAWK